jgi:arylsulfatase A-like enzyme
MPGILSQIGALNGPWIEFPNARTNSPATDISVPSMLTGTDPTDGGDKLEAMPFVFDLAHAAGYRTAFFTPQDYTWANLNDFFRPAAIDTYVTGDRLGLAYVNDIAVDDAEVAELVAKQIEGLKPHEKAFIVVNTNAFHLPLQSGGKMAAPSAITGRQERAAFILERVYGLIFSSLDKAGRLRNALLIITSDHGEADSDRPRDVGRLLNHYEEAINVPFFVHLPKDTPPEIERQVRANAGEPVENSDIAPTLADYLGYSSPLGYAGFSLIRRVPSDRLTVSVSTCEWKQWSKSAFGMARGNERFIFVQDSGSRLFDMAKDPKESRAVTSGERCDWYLRRAETIPCIKAILLRNKP